MEYIESITNHLTKIKILPVQCKKRVVLQWWYSPENRENKYYKEKTDLVTNRVLYG